jgi:hypothetical protein
LIYDRDVMYHLQISPIARWMPGGEFMEGDGS